MIVFQDRLGTNTGKENSKTKNTVLCRDALEKAQLKEAIQDMPDQIGTEVGDGGACPCPTHALSSNCKTPAAAAAAAVFFSFLRSMEMHKRCVYPDRLRPAAVV